ncbi:MAG TPA: HlyD family secretion protein [Candidatus Sulfotelmatobacter sp.]|jgi:membrane fusion protein (multidrug efflux system)|nr:HlyD family secretion protein [Candidatus Sulfotelmatobacter sp.]
MSETPTNPPAAPPATPTAPPPEKKSGFNFNSPLFLVPAAIVLAVLLYLGLGYLAVVLTHESTDDAFIAGHVVSIAPRIAGQVVNVHVLDNQMVHSNDLLVEIDPADDAVAVAQKQAAAASQDANFRTVVAAYELMQSKVNTAEVSARKAVADAAASAATATNAQANFQRSQDLTKDNTISKQEFDAAQAANDSAQANFKSAQENVEEENSKVDEAKKQLDAVFAEKDMALSQLNEAQTNVAAAQLTLSYTKIFAPCDGRVTRKAVETGDYLQAAQQIMSIVPPEVWVVANFKESQLKKMQPGQHVDVEIDALGGRIFSGKLDSVQAGSGAAFSLLPPENATGNFVKVVQRVPVKILFDEPLPADKVLGPGMSVEPSVQVGSFAPSDWLVALVAIGLAIMAVFAFKFFAGDEDKK